MDDHDFEKVLGYAFQLLFSSLALIKMGCVPAQGMCCYDEVDLFLVMSSSSFLTVVPDGLQCNYLLILLCNAQWNYTVC